MIRFGRPISVFFIALAAIIPTLIPGESSISPLHAQPLPPAAAPQVADSFTWPVDRSKSTWGNGYNGHTPRPNDWSPCYNLPYDRPWHAGQDYGFSAVKTGNGKWTNSTPVLAVANGIVKYSSKKGSGGTTTYPGGVVIIEHLLPDNTTIYSMYGHLDHEQILVGANDLVTKGQLISRGLKAEVVTNKSSGATSDNTHLHLEIRYFYSGAEIKKAPDYKFPCATEPGPGYTYHTDDAVAHPDNFSGVIGKNKDGTLIYKTYRWTNPEAFISARLGASTGPSGILDSTFGTDGKVTTPIGVGSGIMGLAVQGDGKILAGGNSFTNATSWDFTVARYNSSGSLDTTFGSSGVATVDFFGSFDKAEAMAVQPDGKILIVGQAQKLSTATEPPRNDFGIVRFNNNGSLDTSFNGSGKVTTDTTGNNSLSHAEAILVQPDGRIVAAGYTRASSTDLNIALARYNADGSLDQTFGGDGTVVTDLGGLDHAYSIAIQSDGRLIVVGSSQIVSSNSDFVVLRYNNNGSLDTSFGPNGTGTIVNDLGANDAAVAVAIQADGKIVVVGTSSTTTSATDFAVVRYDSTGNLDGSFGAGGKVFTSIGPADTATAVAIQTDGKIVVVGWTADSSEATDYNLALVRYTSNGGLDTSFGVASTGKVITTFGPYRDQAGAVVIQGDGKIIVGGSAGSDTSEHFALARYTK